MYLSVSRIIYLNYAMFIYISKVHVNVFVNIGSVLTEPITEPNGMFFCELYVADKVECNVIVQSIIAYGFYGLNGSEDVRSEGSRFKSPLWVRCRVNL